MRCCDCNAMWCCSGCNTISDRNDDNDVPYIGWVTMRGVNLIEEKNLCHLNFLR